MSTRPDFATLMGEHAATGSDEQKIDGEWVWGFDCECGEFVPDTQCNQHLAAALNRAIDAWLADEGTREASCVVMHDAYEAAATANGWETQERSRKPWSDVPDANKRTMRAAVDAALAALTTPTTTEPEEGKR